MNNKIVYKKKKITGKKLFRISNLVYTIKKLPGGEIFIVNIN